MLRYLDIDGHRLAALVLDADLPGEPTVLIHGISQSVLIWGPDRSFRGAGPVYSLSLLDHFPAASPADRRVSSADIYADLLAEAVRRLTGGRPATLAGVSTGGFAVLAVAARAPELVRRVVCIAPFAQGHFTGSYGILQRLARSGRLGQRIFTSLMLISGSHPILVRAVVRTTAPLWRWRPHAAYPHYDEVLNAVIPTFHYFDRVALCAAFAAFYDIDITAWLPAITAPVLVVTGACDPIVPPDQGRLIAERVPRAELSLFPDTGHLVHYEQPDGFDRVLRDFMQRTATHGRI